MGDEFSPLKEQLIYQVERSYHIELRMRHSHGNFDMTGIEKAIVETSREKRDFMSK